MRGASRVVALGTMAAALAACGDLFEFGGGGGARAGFPLGLAAKKAPAPVRFPLGVASGEVTPTGAVLWTRSDPPVRLKVQVSESPSFPPDGTLEKRARAKGSSDGTAEVLVRGLDPATLYHYRFVAAGEYASAVGSFRTAPEPDAAATVRFAFTGDTDGTRTEGVPAFNEFEVLDRVREEQPDFWIYLGDTIYADSYAAPAPAATLEDYRARYRENRGYDALRNLMAATSTYAIWDDHEVHDDFVAATVDPALLAAGRRAFEEYMPLRRASRKTGFFRHFRWGSAVELFILDERSFRSESAVSVAQGDPFPTLPAELRAQLGLGLPDAPPPGTLEMLADPGRTMLGRKQKELFRKLLLESDATFKFVVNEVVMSELFALPYDRWEGFLAEREELLRFVADNGIGNVVFLTTDQHTNAVLDIRVSALQGTPVVAKEVVAGPVAEFTLVQEIERTFGPGTAPLFVGFVEALNPPEFSNHDAFGYGLVEVDPVAGTATISLKDSAGNLLHATTVP